MRKILKLPNDMCTPNPNFSDPQSEENPESNVDAVNNSANPAANNEQGVGPAEQVSATRKISKPPKVAPAPDKPVEAKHEPVPAVSESSDPMMVKGVAAKVISKNRASGGGGGFVVPK
jgi:hypothetical protein